MASLPPAPSMALASMQVPPGPRPTNLLVASPEHDREDDQPLGPQVEGPLRRVPVFLAEERPDVLLVAGGLVGPGTHDRLPLLVGRCHGEAPPPGTDPRFELTDSRDGESAGTRAVGLRIVLLPVERRAVARDARPCCGVAQDPQCSYAIATSSQASRQYTQLSKNSSMSANGASSGNSVGWGSVRAACRGVSGR